jgi:hypothetical protein
LVERDEQHLLVAGNDIFGAVAVVTIEVHDGDAVGLAGNEKSRDGDGC